MRVLGDAQVRNQRVLVRVGFDVPVDNSGVVTDDIRISESLPTIQFLLEKQARIILLSHKGRPDGRLDPDDTLLPAAQTLELLLKHPIQFVTEKLEDRITSLVNNLPPGEIMLLENLRFHPGEEANDPRFSQWLASLGDVYINDAFSDAHRPHASMVGVPKLLPSFAGLALEKEVTTLSKLLSNPEHPVVAVIGGAKLESKLPVIEHLLPVADHLLIGGRLVDETLPENPKIINATDKNQVSGVTLDIGPESIALYQKYLAGAKTIFWSGPIGKFEDPRYEAGTREVAQAIAQNPGLTIAGGGDTLAALKKFGLRDQFKFLSTGGSAMLVFLAGKSLPGLEVLK